MSDNIYIYIISPIVTAVIAGVTYFVKRYLNNLDTKIQEEKDDRQKRRAEVDVRLTKAETEIAETQKRLKKVFKLVINCKHEDCPTKTKVAELLDKDEI